MEKDELVEIIKSCLTKLFASDKELIDIKVHEDALNGRLAGYLRQSLEKGVIRVDTEYDRHKDQLKRYGVEGKSAIVDIVVHQRQSDEHNIVAFECKKNKISQVDLNKIEALIGPEFNYQFGVTIEYFNKIVKVYRLADKEIVEEIIEL